MEQLIDILVSVFVAAGIALLRIRQVSKANAEQRLIDKEDEAQQRRNLEQRVNDQMVIITDLRSQVQELSGFKVLYNTLLESHGLLKKDHEELKTEFAKLKAARDEDMNQHRQLQTKYDDLKTENGRLFESNKRLSMEKQFNDSRWLMLGDAIQALVPPDPPLSPKTQPVTATEPQEESSDEEAQDDAA